MNRRILAACGNDCWACPRYTKKPYTKTDEELSHTALLWQKIGYRDRIVSNEEIACTGCREGNWCRYKIIQCVKEKQVDNCGLCEQYPCEKIKSCFEVTQSFEPKCKEVCTKEEYETLKKAFFEKEKNLNQSHKGREF